MTEDRASYTVPGEALPDRRTETLAWFSEQVRERLEANRGKGEWRDMGWARLYRLLCVEMEELTVALPGQDGEAVIHEAADVAAFAMMIADVARMRLERGEG